MPQIRTFESTARNGRLVGAPFASGSARRFPRPNFGKKGDDGAALVCVSNVTMTATVTTAAARRALERVRRIALALPEANERPSHGMPTFFVAGKKTFAMFADRHHGDARTALWFAAPPGVQEALAATERYFRPPYVGCRGWVGVALDAHTDWNELRDLLRDSYLHVAPRRLGALLER